MGTELIVALDFSTADEALDLVDELKETVGWYKVGLELYLNSGGRILSELKMRRRRVFLDLKFHDIPNTVHQAAAWAAGTGVDLITVHALGGQEMMRRAVEGAREGAARAGVKVPQVVGVTVLTSMDKAALAAVGIPDAPQMAVPRLAKLAQAAGLDGVVCSGQELALLKDMTAPFVTVCPGIRPKGASTDDQSRILTPAQAAAEGATYIVVGRPIRLAEDPAQAARAIVKELREGEQK